MILSSLVWNGEQVRRKIRNQPNGDIAHEKTRSFVFQNCKKAIKLLRKSTQQWYFDHSFLSFDLMRSNFIETHSFTVDEFDLSGYNDTEGFEFRNPVFEHSFKSKNKNRVFINFKGKLGQSKDFVMLEMTTISAFFFGLEFEKLKVNCLSNLVGMRYYDPVFGSTSVQDMNNFIEKIQLELEIYYLPFEEEVLENVVCGGYDFEGKGDPVFGYPVGFDEEKMRVTCEFGVYFDIGAYKFGVFSKKV